MIWPSYINFFWEFPKSFCLIEFHFLNVRLYIHIRIKLLTEDEMTSLPLLSKKYSISQNFKRKFLVFFTLRPYPLSEYLQHHSYNICQMQIMYSNNYKPNFNSTYKSNVSRDNWCTSQYKYCHLANYLVLEIELQTEI